MSSEREYRQYLSNLRVAQARIVHGDVRWYVVNSPGHVIKGPFPSSGSESLALGKAQALDALEDLRRRALEELEDEEPPEDARAIEEHQERKYAKREQKAVEKMEKAIEAANDKTAWRGFDATLDDRRSWQAYHDAGLPWTGEFEDAVNRGEVDVS